jgi:hypothetical protein
LQTLNTGYVEVKDLFKVEAAIYGPLPVKLHPAQFETDDLELQLCHWISSHISLPGPQHHRRSVRES